ncbi:MAG: hypothetical protein JSU66_02605 [Deltaproteobacteria bacterium]|nr:MAG: hypothetical protein JSU66_02605 [Deltaproteobacteria bacterium]
MGARTPGRLFVCAAGRVAARYARRTAAAGFLDRSGGKDMRARLAARFAMASFAVLSGVFWRRCGGMGEPLTPGEVDAPIAEIEANARSLRGDDPERIAAFRRVAEADAGDEFYGVKLIRRRARAQYPGGGLRRFAGYRTG